MTNKWIIFVFLLFTTYCTGQHNKNDSGVGKEEYHEEYHYIDFIMLNGIDYQDANILGLRVAYSDIDYEIGVIQECFGRNRRPENSTATIYAPYWPVGTKLYKIKGIDEHYYLAAERKDEQYGNKYYVYRHKENKAMEKQMQRLFQTLTKAEQKAYEKAEKAKNDSLVYLWSNRWPDRVVFENEFYTYIKMYIEDSQIETVLEEVKRNVDNGGVYIKNFQWQNGDAIHDEGTPICSIKGVDKHFYIALDARKIIGNSFGGFIEVYKKDKTYNAEAEKVITKMYDDCWNKREKARKREWYITNRQPIPPELED